MQACVLFNTFFLKLLIIPFKCEVALFELVALASKLLLLLFTYNVGLNTSVQSIFSPN